MDELLTTELIFSNAFADLSPEEIAAVLSTMLTKEKDDNEPTLTPPLKKARHTLPLPLPTFIFSDNHGYSSVPTNLLFHFISSNFPSPLQALADVKAMVKVVTAVQVRCGVEGVDEVDQLKAINVALAEVVYEWARGTVRNILRNG